MHHSSYPLAEGGYLPRLLLADAQVEQLGAVARLLDVRPVVANERRGQLQPPGRAHGDTVPARGVEHDLDAALARPGDRRAVDIGHLRIGAEEGTVEVERDEPDHETATFFIFMRGLWGHAA